MNAPREQVMQALFSLLSANYNWVSSYRRFKMWDEVPPELRPCLIMIEHNESGTGGSRNLTPITTLNINLIIYANTKDADAPAAILNPILDAVDFALRPDNIMDGKLKLGGLVDHVWREGQTIKVMGDDDGDGILIIPIKILAP